MLDIEKLLKNAEEKTMPKGAVIFQEGQKDDNFYIVLGGEVEISKKTTIGESKVMAHLKSGDFFGEGVLSGVLVKPATATAITDVTLLTISHGRFYTLLKEDPEAGVHFLMNVIEVINHRLKKSNDTLLAVFEMDNLLTSYKGEIDELGQKILHQIMLNLQAEKGLFLLKKPYTDAYRIMAASDPDLTDEPLKNFDSSTSAIHASAEGSWMLVRVGNAGLMAFLRPGGTRPFLDEDLRLAILVADEADQVIENVYHRASEKARQLLRQKKIVL